MTLVELLLTIQNQLRIYHWQTESFAEHKALGSAYENLDGLIDTFVETYISRYGRPKTDGKFTISMQGYSENMRSVIKNFTDVLVNDFPKAFSNKDTDLLNIRDEMLGLLNKLLYLLSLK